MSSTTTPIPAGHNTINPFVLVPDATRFIEFVEAVFDGHEAQHVRTPDRDGSLIHAEVRVGTSTIMLCDSKEDWPFTPAFLQIYVPDANACLRTATAHGAQVITPLSDFYGGYQLARMLDPWHNIWWLYEAAERPQQQAERESDTDWHDREPSKIYTTLMDTMSTLRPPSNT